jgi:hypothetical protein
VYTAPFLAPLSYVGVGLLLIANRMERGAVAWGRWVVTLALGGFVGNLGLALLDHAQNGFFVTLEWIPVIAAAFGVGFLSVAVVSPGDGALLRAALWVMVIEGLVGAIGFVLHLLANLSAPGDDFGSQFIHGAPVFAPLLFSNLALLGGLGLQRLRTREAPPPRDPVAPIPDGAVQ